MTALALEAAAPSILIAPGATHSLREYVVPREDGAVNQVMVVLQVESGHPGCVRQFDQWELIATLDGDRLPVVSTASIRWGWLIERLLTSDEVDRLVLCAMPLDCGEVAA